MPRAAMARIVSASLAVSSAFSPAAGSSSSSRRGLGREGAGDLQQALLAVGELPRRCVCARWPSPTRSSISATRASTARSCRRAQPGRSSAAATPPAVPR